MTSPQEWSSTSTGGCPSSFIFEVTSTGFELKNDFSSLDDRISAECLDAHGFLPLPPLLGHGTSRWWWVVHSRGQLFTSKWYNGVV